MSDDDTRLRPTTVRVATPTSSTYRRTTCRLCGSADLELILDLGEQHLQGAFQKPGVAEPPRDRYPVQLLRCRDAAACGLVQLAHTVPREHLYSTYWYRSRVNITMRIHLRRLARSSSQFHGGRPSRVLDIGCNDGTLLTAFQEVGATDLWGVEPSNAGVEVSPDVHLTRDFFPLDTGQVSGPFDIITSVAMFYDVDDPVAFAREVERRLATDGLWVVELGYCPWMLSAAAYDAVCHEHLTYYSFGTFERVTAAAGLEVVHVELNDINGRSMCCYVRRKSPDAPATTDAVRREIEAFRARELEYGLDKAETYERFAAAVVRHRHELRGLLGSIREQGRTIHAYGASTKGNTVLQYCGFDTSTIDCAAERNPNKVGARTPGSDIEIVSESESRRRRPDYYLVLPWQFREEIIQRETATMAAGTAMIFPLPSVEVVTG